MAYDDRTGRPVIPIAILWLLALWVVVVLVALVWGVDNAETGLRDRARQRIAASGYDVAVDFSGRDARLIGVVDRPETAIELGETIDAIPGVRLVSNEIVVDEPAAVSLRMPEVSFRLIGEVASIRGLVPDEATELTVLDAMAVQYGQANVVSALIVADDVEAMPWLTRIQDVFAPLAGLRSGGFTANATGLRVTGEVISEAVAAELTSGLELVVGPQLAVTTELTIAVLPPPTFAASGRADTVVLEGILPSEESRERISTAAERVFADATIIDVLRIGDVAGPPWLEAIEGILDIAARLDPWAIEVADETVTLTGSGQDRDVIAALDILLEGVVGETLAINVDVEVAASAIAAELTSLLEGVATFDPNGTALSAAGIAQLDLAIEILEANPATVLVVEGHTDSQGDFASNLVLSQQRAEAVVAYLVGGGIDAGRLSAVGYGEGRPIADNATLEGRAQNRRIEFAIREGDG